jgi:tetratricopeptide (TPR) repeat protein
MPDKTMKLYTWILLTVLSVGASAQSADRTLVMEYIQDQRYDEAIAYLKQTTTPKDIALLGYTYYQAGKIAEASAAYRQVLSIDSNYISAHQYLGTMQLQQELPLNAAVHFHRIVELQPNNAAAWKQLSFAAFAGKMEDSGFVWLQKAYELKPSDPRVVARLSEEWMEKKRYITADSLINVFLATDSSANIILMTGVKSSCLRKDYTRTLALANKLMSLNLTSSNTFLYAMAACYNKKWYTDCERIYEYLLERNSAPGNIIYYAAMAKTQLKKYNESNELLKTCITLALSKDLDSYYNGMSVNYEALKQYKPAIASLDTAYFLFHEPLRQYSIGRIYDTYYKNEALAQKYYKKYMVLYKPESTEEEKSIYNYLKTRITP